MRMTIDKSILYMSLYKQRLEESISDGLEEDIEAYDVAIDIMRKYQRIEEAYKKYQNDLVNNIYADKKFVKALEEVFEDGND